MKYQTLIQQLYQQVERDPGRIAVVSDVGSLTFSELWDRSGRIAHALQGRGVGADQIIGVFIDSSIELEVAIWGVLRAGAAYLPLSPEYPSARLQYAVKDSGATLVLTSAALADDARLIGHSPGGVVVLEECPSDPAQGANQVAPENLAYVIYTSGSTGNPKGVAIEHHSIVHQLNWLRDSLAIDGSVRILQKTPFSFDAAQWEILSVALGATVVMAGIGAYRDPARLIATAARHGVNTLQCVPTLWSALLETEGFGALPLTQIFSGGEALTSRLARGILEAHPAARLTNLYGPTETTINASAHVVNPAELDDTDRVLPIGLPVSDTELVILDPVLGDVAQGALGELYIAGPQLARGYINRPDLTEAKFVTLADERGDDRRLYRTGDLAVKGSDGVVSFAGRLDNQVKINGHRIELDEIRLAIENHRWIRQATVVPWRTRLNSMQLAAFIELDADEAALMDQNVAGNHHRSKASRRQVNAQMVNSTFRTVEEVNGKGALQLPHGELSEAAIADVFARKTYRNFRTGVRAGQIERALSAIFQPARERHAEKPLDIDGLGRILRWFGPFASESRLLPKYAYASPGALTASQIFVECSGLPGLAEGLYYFHPAEHTLTQVSDSVSFGIGLRLHILGKRTRIREVYSTNVDEVLHLEAGHMLGLLEEIAAPHGLNAIHAGIPSELLPQLSDGDEYTASLSVDLTSGAASDGNLQAQVLLQFHEETQDGVAPGLYRFFKGRLKPAGEILIRRKDVIAINQAVYDRSAFGVGFIVPRDAGWRGFVELGRLLHRLQTSDPEIGLMSSGYSSLSGHEMATSIRIACFVENGEAGFKDTISYFALGGGISPDQRASRGMGEDVVHMRGPAEILKDDLRALLPEYMVPQRVKIIESVPVTPSGKVDLQTLRQSLEEEEQGRPIVLPRNRGELEVAAIWTEILRLAPDELSVTDSFFDAGGNSLHAIALINRLNSRFGTRLPIQALFAAPTIEALAREIALGAVSTAGRLIDLNPPTAGPSLYIWPGLGGYPLGLRALAQMPALAAYRFRGLQAHGINADELPFVTIQEMAAADIALIAAEQPVGPVVCIGYSFGARVAFEAAYQLEQSGRTVDHVILIAPGSPLQQPGNGTQTSPKDIFADRRFVRILLSVFTGTLNSPFEQELFNNASGEDAFIDFVVGKYENLGRDLVTRIVSVVKQTFSFEYTFDELNQRNVAAPISIIKASGDDYSFLEASEVSGRPFHTIIELAHDHYSVIRGAGLPALAEALRSTLSSERETVMPHISVKHFPADIDEGRRQILADELTSAVIKAFGCAPNAVSVALEPVEQEHWDAVVYQPEIIARQQFLVREPKYGIRQAAK